VGELQRKTRDGSILYYTNNVFFTIARNVFRTGRSSSGEGDRKYKRKTVVILYRLRLIMMY